MSCSPGLSQRCFSLLLVAAFLLGSGEIGADQAAFPGPSGAAESVLAENGMVATEEALATRIGVDVLKKGGNAVDAAVAVGFALAVTLPQAGNLGGGGFMLIHSSRTDETVVIDYREAAPMGASRDMYLDGRGDVDLKRVRFSHLAAGVPGTVAGLALAQERYGTLSLKELLAPAIALAQGGVVVSAEFAASLSAASSHLRRWPQSARVFFKADGSTYVAGERLVQPDLASSLEQIARQGQKAFYEGAIAEKIVREMEKHDGLITKADLRSYRAMVRKPVVGTYRGYTIRSVPPPSSGGVHLIQMLNILEAFPIEELGVNSANSIHLMAETMKVAYRDRSRYLGDPDFVDVPVSCLVSKAYAAKSRARIDRTQARSSVVIAPGDPLACESEQTTHYSVMDAAGNVVSNTYTLNFSYGSGIVVGGTGILLNNEMDDFSAKPGAANAYGLVGGKANAVAPGKRPLSSMTPTLVFNNGRPVLVTGTPGGSRIITTVLQIIMNVVDHGMDIATATATPRVHHQWLPDKLQVERGLSLETLGKLARMGYDIETRDAMGSAQSIVRGSDGFIGVSDPRTPGGLALGY
jgi:gamma-glutamyltranspeptidase/glutathione hydrolase